MMRGKTTFIYSAFGCGHIIKKLQCDGKRNRAFANDVGFASEKMSTGDRYQ